MLVASVDAHVVVGQAAPEAVVLRLPQDGERGAQVAAAEDLGLARSQRPQQGAAAVLLGLGHLVGEPGRGGAAARRILEYVHAGQRKRPNQAVARVKQALVL